MKAQLILSILLSIAVGRCGPGREGGPGKEKDEPPAAMASGSLSLDGQSNLNLTIVHSAGFVSIDESNQRRFMVAITESPSEGIGARGVYVVFRGIPKSDSQFNIALRTEGDAAAELPASAWLGTAIERSAVSGTIHVIEAPHKLKKEFTLLVDLFSVIGNIRFKGEARGPVADPQALLF